MFFWVSYGELELTDWLTDGLTDWLIDWLIDWLTDRNWLIDDKWAYSAYSVLGTLQKLKHLWMAAVVQPPWPLVRFFRHIAICPWSHVMLQWWLFCQQPHCNKQYFFGMFRISYFQQQIAYHPRLWRFSLSCGQKSYWFGYCVVTLRFYTILSTILKCTSVWH